MLIVLAGGVALLFALGAFAASPPGRGATGSLVARGGCVAVSAVLALVGLSVLAAGGPAEAVVLPLGPIRGRAVLSLDGLSAWFLVPLGIVGAACALAAAEPAPPPAARGGAAVPLVIAGLALCFAAADGALMLCGLGLVLLVVATGGEEPSAAPAVAAAGLLCFGAAFGLLGGAAAPFDLLRASPPEGWRAAAVPFLGLAGAGALAAALPLAASRGAAGSAEIGPLLAAALPLAAVYVLARLLPDLGGPAQPSWWGLPLLAGGGAGAVAAALRAASAEEAGAVPVWAGASVSGLCAMALGAALVFRGADLGTLAALAAGGALLLASGGGLALAALALVAAVLARSAGSARLDRLGGLARFMPIAAAVALLAVATLALLPLFPGFAGFWALLQALVSGWRLGGAALPLFCAGALVLAASAAAILAAAMLRVFAAVFLGRPRTPRGAGARDVEGLARWALLIPVAPLVPLGLLPGWALSGGRGALAAIAGRAPLPTRGAGLVLAEGGAAYAPLLLAAVLALLAAALAALVAKMAPPGGAAREPAWEGGFLAPPPHLPFGDPLTQPSAAGLAEPLRRPLRGLAPAKRRPSLPVRRVRSAARAVASAGAASGGALLVLAAALAALALARVG